MGSAQSDTGLVLVSNWADMLNVILGLSRVKLSSLAQSDTCTSEAVLGQYLDTWLVWCQTGQISSMLY